MTAFDEGLLSPVSVGRDDLVSDASFLAALVGAERALVAAYVGLGHAPAEVRTSVEREFGVERGRILIGAPIDLAQLADAAVSGGNPVIPLVTLMKERLPAEARIWVHRGATSQDVWDTAILVVARRAVAQVRRSLDISLQWLSQLASAHRDEVAAARTLTQHAVPTTVGLRVAGWARSIHRALSRLETLEFPVQLAGAGGTLASFAEITGSPEGARTLVARFAEEVGLDDSPAPWHVARWPITELGDALVSAVDALGKMAADVATLSRTEIGEVAEGVGGGSSAMPQKQNPAEAVLIRSAAIRAPHLAATLHLAAALAVDERSDGAWHAEWPTLRELLRLALGASAHAANLVAHLRVDAAQVAANVGAGDGLLIAERLSVVLTPLLGKEAVAAIVTEVGAGADLRRSVSAALATASVDRDVDLDVDLDVDALIDPANYTGLAGVLVDETVQTLADAHTRRLNG